MKNKVLKNNLRYFRQQAKMTQTELAARAGLSQNSISAIECGTFYPTVYNALRIIEVLEVPFECLFYFEETT